MGEVYRAHDSRLDRPVAIKVLPAHLTENAERKRRLEQEARAVSRLSHPHICTLHDIGQENGVDFMVMELLEGETLADRLHRGAVSLEQALEHARQMADALDEAHRHDIVDRDLKPGNVFLTRSGVKLLDFGLAKLHERKEARETIEESGGDRAPSVRAPSPLPKVVLGALAGALVAALVITLVTGRSNPPAELVTRSVIELPRESGFRGGTVSIRDGTEVLVAAGIQQTPFDWAPDGRIVATGPGDEGLVIVAAEGRTPVPLKTVDRDQGERYHLFPQFLPASPWSLRKPGTSG